MSGSADVAPAGLPTAPGTWEGLLTPGALDVFCESWLAIQCQALGAVHAAALAWRRVGDAELVVLAEQPAQAARGLRELLEQSDLEGRGLALADEEVPERIKLSHLVALPRGAHAVVAVEIDHADEAALARCMRQLQWGGAWLELRLGAALRSQGGDLASPRAAALLDLVAVAVEAASFDESAQAVVTQLASALGCDRVSLGFEQRGHTRVVALSHSAEFGKQMNLMVAIAAAMDEARDQGATIVHPAPRGAARARVDLEHERLRREHGAQCVMTVPLLGPEGSCGALTLELAAEGGFTEETVQLVEAAAAALAPLLLLRRRDDRALPVKALHAARDQAARMLGPGHLGRKLLAIAGAAIALFFLVARADYRISADAVLEGSSRRVIVAPFDGYVAVADRRAGDFVRASELLAQLDDRDLRFEQLKWASRNAQHRRQYDEARAARERAQASILAAQIEEAEAELARIGERIERTRITAPFDGLIVAGDLTQALGAAVSRGEVLFELAPLDRYRVLLDVDEQQIGDVALGQRGTVLLAALPDEPLPFEVTAVTPIAKAEEGLNFFRVEGVLDEVSERLRPGMEGVGKIEAGERSLFWIWTRGLQTWLRLWLWSWWP